MFLIRLLAALSRILWHSATTAFTLWCSTPQFVMNGSVSTTNRSSNATKRIALFMECLNHATLIQRKVVYSGTLVKTKIDKFLNVSGSRHCSIEQQCREVALCWRDVPDG